MSRAVAGSHIGTAPRNELQTSGIQASSAAEQLLPKAVVAFAGARDAYQVPLALAEAGLLECLVTDRYFPACLSPFLLILGRSELVAGKIPVSRVRVSTPAFRHFVAEKLGRGSLGGWDKGVGIGKSAQKLASATKSAIFSYSTSAFEAFKNSRERYKFLFQFHPHPQSVRKILLEELERLPWTAPSLRSEPELALSEDKFEMLRKEAAMADGIIVASSFTAETLIENGIPANHVHLVPYGVDAITFYAESRDEGQSLPLRVAFVGNLEQRKGVSYLLEAIRLADPKFVRLVICSRSHPRPFWQDELPRNCEFHIGLSRAKMVRVLGSCDLLALPSLVEGFGHVVLEGMSLGLPVIATSHTGAPDVISHGHDGFIVPIRNPHAIADGCAWALENPEQLREMARCARRKALQFSWDLFRARIRIAYEHMIADKDSEDGN